MLVKCNNVYPKVGGVFLNYHGVRLPPLTIRLKYRQGVIPSFSKGTGVLVDSTNNIWDLTYENNDWNNLLKNHSDLIEILEANTTGVTNMNLMFYDCSSLTSVPLFDTSNVTNMDQMFRNCSTITSIPLFDTSKVTNMQYMFRNCGSLTSVPLFDTSKVTNMNFMFNGCESLTSVPLFDTSNVIYFAWMFEDCESLTSIPLFDTSKVTNMNYMFNGCANVESGALALYQQAASKTTVPNHVYTFRNCGSNTTTGAAELAQIPGDWK